MFESINKTIYIVSTPIGNLSDITPRALEILGQVDFIAAEDTRHSQRLLSHFDIKTPLYPLHLHNENQNTEFILNKLQEQGAMALVSDAGTPIISDPGFALIHEAKTRGIDVVPIPGPCALIAALVASGLPANKFSFEGFLPIKSLARQHALEALKTDHHTLIFYEAPHRIISMLKDCQTVFGPDRLICVARELTKKFETIKTDIIETLVRWIEQDKNQQKGEFVVIISGAKLEQNTINLEAQNILKTLNAELPINQAAQLAAKITGLPKRELYDYLLSIK